MYKKHLSEKIARVFEIVGYFQLIPAILIVALSAFFIFPLLISIPPFVIGLTFLIGYVKHSRCDLDESKVVILWIATFLFNFLPLLFVMSQCYDKGIEIITSFGICSVALISWWVIACCLSMTAFYDEIVEGKSKLK